MGERPAGAQPPEEKPKERLLDLSVPQVAGSAVAAVVAAKLASNLGVYGTILGAGVVSALGTCGGSIFQHFFRRTGTQVHKVAAQAKPRARLVRPHARGAGPATAAGTAPKDLFGALSHDGTRTLGTPEEDRTRTAEAAHAADADPTRLFPAADPAKIQVDDPGETRSLGVTGTGALPLEEFGEATVHRARTRVRGWKRPLVAVLVAFGLTMGGITAYEAVAGENISGNGKGTTIGDAFKGSHSSGHRQHQPSTGSTTTPPTSTPGGTGDPRPTQRPNPGTTDPSRTEQPTPTPTPTPTQPSTPPPTTTPNPGTTDEPTPSPTSPPSASLPPSPGTGNN
ncbi:hypothetical protein OG552_11800 [Streptomyces sp. NBC_01476]|uniref:hypothetical protein n=1 Tax=Streptomyces sp. NBC_01476 TaxID=2903881 RepID=UPI002E32209A|nr:hypothetical protein [Streptomyces sp. NBC_01476]